MQDAMEDPRPIYLDCNATTPLDPAVQVEVLRYLTDEFGNAGSRTHERGAIAKAAVQQARQQVASVVDAQPSDVVFTSGATESDNLAILGLEAFGVKQDRRHIISTQIEHKAVLEPLAVLSTRGFEIDLTSPEHSGRIHQDAVREQLRPDTLLVSVMHANNETGIIQPINEIAESLGTHPAYFHVDAAQGFGKDLEPLCNPRIDLISISGHKIFAPKGIGALIVRRRGYERPPLASLMFGGGQERGLRPGTLPVPLIVGLGVGAETAVRDHDQRLAKNRAFRDGALEALSVLNPVEAGDSSFRLPNTLNLSFPGVDAEAAMVALKGLIEVSNGSACTSSSYEPSHVLEAMGLDEGRIRGSIRISWCHLTERPSWTAVVSRLQALL